MKLGSILSEIDRKYPFLLQEEWDNSGLQIGNPMDQIRGIMVGLDLTEKMIAKAIESKCNLIITHHPLFFSPVKSLNFSRLQAKKVRELILRRISLISLHTNLDSAAGGINDYLADLFEGHSTQLLASREKIFKITVFVPESHLDEVKTALIAGGASVIGNYDCCFFAAPGTGSFRGNPSTRPFIGKPGAIEQVDEVRLETICRERHLRKSLNNMLAVHPYQEVAYDFFEVQPPSATDGIGRIRHLDSPVKASAILGILRKNGFQPQAAGDLKKIVRKIAICSGSSGREIVSATVNRRLDLLLTGELRYHDSLELQESGILPVSLGHFGSETCFSSILKDFLQTFFKGLISVPENE